MERFLIYNAEGKSLVVDAEIGKPFYFCCPEEECGLMIILEGVIRYASFKEFTKVRDETVMQNKEFKVLERIIPKQPIIFEGSVNGRQVKLPVERLEDVAERFIDMYLNL